MEFSHLFTLFMTILMSSTASRNHVFVRTGDSVKLDINNEKLAHLNSFVWKNDQLNKNIVRFENQSGDLTPYGVYKDRVDFNNKTFSLTLKNMQKTDSGLYRARATGQKDKVVAEHNVSVMDPVDPPVLNWTASTVSVDSCTVNVTCVGDVLTLITSFHSNNCSQEEVTSAETQTLTLHCTENTVICNYSNPVSWKNDTVEINQLCTTHKKNPEESNSYFPLHWILIIAIVPLLVFAVVSVICCSYKKRKEAVQEENDHTIYAQVQMVPHSKTEARRPLEMLEKSANPQTVYGFIEEHEQTYNNSPEGRTRADRENPLSTTYSTINSARLQQTSVPTETDNTIYSTVSKSSQGRKPAHS